MNKFQQSILVAATVIGLGSASFVVHAQKAEGEVSVTTQKPDGHKWHHGGKSPERMKERMAKRQAELHDKLKLSAGQEAAWKTFIASKAHPDMGKRPDHAEWAKMTAPERADKMLARMKEKEARMVAHVAAMKTFYATLTPEQKKVFDEHAMHMGRHGRGGHDRK